MFDHQAAFERHLVHHAEDVAARRLGEADVVGVEAAEGVDRHSLLEQCAFEQTDDPPSDRAQLGEADIGDEDREQRAGVDDQQALAPIEPEHVRVPIVVARRRFGEAEPFLAEQR